MRIHKNILFEVIAIVLILMSSAQGKASKSCLLPAGPSPVSSRTTQDLESLEGEFQIIKICKNEIAQESQLKGFSYVQTCLCGSSSGVRKGFRETYESAKLILSHPRDAAKSLYNTMSHLDQVGRDVYDALLKQEWIVPGEQPVRLTDAERAAVHCEVMGTFLLGGNISAAFTNALIKRKFLKPFTAMQTEKIKFQTVDSVNQSNLEEAALQKVSSKIDSQGRFDVISGEGDFANYKTINLVDEDGKILGYGSFEYEPSSKKLNVGSLHTEENFRQKGVGEAVIAKALSEHPNAKEVAISVFSGTNRDIIRQKMSQGASLEDAIRATASYKSFEKMGFSEILETRKLPKGGDFYGVVLRRK